MDFNLTQEQSLIQKTTREFAEKELVPIAAKLDHDGVFPREIVDKLAELGLLGVAVPEQYGGAGMDNVCYALAMEEISRGCASTGVIMSVNNSLVCDPLLKYGTEEQKKKWLVPLAQGKILGCFGLTEPNAGSDAASQKTTAVRDGSQWVINGAKNFITNGPQSSVCIVFAMTEPEKGNHGISAFIVPADTRGYAVTRVEDKMGIKASGACSLAFEDVHIPAENLLGTYNKGFGVAMSTLDGGRIGIASQALGIARAAYEKALKYSHDRTSFGKPINQHQAIAFMLADMATELDAARLLIWKAATMKDKGVRHSMESSMAKLYASEMADRVCNKAIQIHGGYGYIKEYQVERHWRDARITELYEGTSEIQRLVISRSLLKD
ncbi:MAG: Acyl-CoA dehydrogenase, short-chain specific [Myxococcota bacterium]|nr:Acyl-CoA dehydrogenase, short-chain specific [Myxococcota bacterium]